MTKIHTEVRFLCDGCPADLTGLPHLRIVINHLAGKRVPPFHGPFPEIPVGCRDITLHGCDGKCLGRAIERLVKVAASTPVTAVEVHPLPVAIPPKTMVPAEEEGILAVVSSPVPKPRTSQNRGIGALLTRVFTLGL